MERNCVVPLKLPCIHQGYELYPFDRSFAKTEVMLSRTGPIVGLFEGVANSIVFEPLWILRRKTLPRLMASAIVTLPLALTRTTRRLARCDPAYINTSVIIDYALAARLFPGKVIRHMHEIPEGVMRPIPRGLTLGSRSRLIFYSRATRDAFAPLAARPGHVIYNGIADPAAWTPADYDGTRLLKILMPGRVNRIKGQEMRARCLELFSAQEAAVAISAVAADMIAACVRMAAAGDTGASPA